jgi:hypothetical protein
MFVCPSFAKKPDFSEKVGLLNPTIRAFLVLSKSIALRTAAARFSLSGLRESGIAALVIQITIWTSFSNFGREYLIIGQITSQYVAGSYADEIENS